MSVFSDHKNERISTRSLIKVVRKYIPPEILPRSDLKKISCSDLEYVEDDGEKLLQSVFDISGHHLRMYNSVKELAGNLKIYRSFTLSNQIFSTLKGPYSIIPTVYRSVSNKGYIYKHDISDHLQNLIFKNFPNLDNPLSRYLIGIHLRVLEGHNNDDFEFLQYNEDEFKQLESEIVALKSEMSDVTNNHFPKSPLYMLNLEDCSFDGILNQFKIHIPSAWETNCDDYISSVLKPLFDDCNLKNDPTPYQQLFYDISILFAELQKIGKKREHWFQPSMWTVWGRNQSLPKQLRVFEDNGEQFLLNKEVNRKMEIEEKNNASHYDSIRRRKEKTSISYHDLRQKFPEQCNHIEFIRVPIIRTKHCAVPIPILPLESPYVLAADALFESLRKMIFGLKFFQIAKEQYEVWDVITEYFTKMEQNFTTTDSIYFVSFETIEDINKTFKECFSKYLKQNTSLTKDVSDVKKDGFTLENLVDELNNLELPDVFPDITGYAETVYQHVLENKKEKFLRTCDLFDAVELCQMICIIKKYSKLTEFLHSQKACYRILIPCEFCSKLHQKRKRSSSEMEDFTDQSKSQHMDNEKDVRPAEKLRKVDEKSCYKLVNESETNWQVNSDDDFEVVKLALKEELDEAKQKNKILEQEVTSLRDEVIVLNKNLEDSLLEQNRLNFITVNGDTNELRESNMKLTIQLEEKEKVIEQLLRRLETSS